MIDGTSFKIVISSRKREEVNHRISLNTCWLRRVFGWEIKKTWWLEKKGKGKGRKFEMKTQNWKWDQSIMRNPVIAWIKLKRERRKVKIVA